MGPDSPPKNLIGYSMQIIEQSHKIEYAPMLEDLQRIESIGRVCYKSEDKITDDSYLPFLQAIIRRGHESVIEHSMITVRFICDRGVSHELVRHRLASFSQESTRYVNYEGDTTFILPSYLHRGSKIYNDSSIDDGSTTTEDNIQLNKYSVWLNAMYRAEEAYNDMLSWGCSPQEARAVLPNSVKTEVVMTANIREWRHVLKLRTSKASHPQMRALMIPLLEELRGLLPGMFDDIKY